jgi:hypothetical protein
MPSKRQDPLDELFDETLTRLTDELREASQSILAARPRYMDDLLFALYCYRIAEAWMSLGDFSRGDPLMKPQSLRERMRAAHARLGNGDDTEE